MRNSSGISPDTIHIGLLYQEAYDKKEMKPLEYLQKKLEHESLVQAAALRDKDYQIAVLELMRLPRYGMPNEPIWYEGIPDCVMTANALN